MILRKLALVLVVGVPAVPGATEEIGVMKFPGGEVQHVVRADDTPWVPCPETLPPGCELAMLEGDLASSDLFTVRFRVKGDLLLRPHWHPKEERVTVISGKVAVGFGLDAKRADATEFGPGDYYVNRRHAVHTVWIEGPTVIQITGIGPWKAVPVTGALPPN